MESPAYQYPGAELELFREAINWKKYFRGIIKPYIRGNVAEPGAGLGTNTVLLINVAVDQWLMIEPDDRMFGQLQEQAVNNKLPDNCKLLHGTLKDTSDQFDCILYIDVLEHIEADKTELEAAFSHLRPGGHLVVLSPAFQHLYNSFDKSIGHYRRYTKKSLLAISPPGAEKVLCRYYDSMGYLASLANRLLLRQSLPSQKQVLFWDRWLIPFSKITDKCFLHVFGKTIITVWKRKEAV